MNKVDIKAAVDDLRNNCPATTQPGANGWHAALRAITDALGLDDARTPHKQLARSTDPASAHEGAARIEPTRGTRKHNVLTLLRESSGWVPAHMISTPEVGGGAGLRRLRELRAEGWDIEIRYVDETRTASEYRLRESVTA